MEAFSDTSYTSMPTSHVTLAQCWLWLSPQPASARDPIRHSNAELSLEVAEARLPGLAETWAMPAFLWSLGPEAA